MIGWSCRKKPAVQKNCKILDPGAFLKLHFSTEAIWLLCKVFTSTIYIYIFWGKKLSSAKITNQSVAMLQMDLVLIMLCDSPIFSVMCFCHTLIDWAAVSHANCLPLDECLYVCFESFIKKKKKAVQMFSKMGPEEKQILCMLLFLRKSLVTWVLGIIQLLPIPWKLSLL